MTINPTSLPGYALCSSAVQVRNPLESEEKPSLHNISNYISTRDQLVC